MFWNDILRNSVHWRFQNVQVLVQIKIKQKKGVKNWSISIEMEILLFGQLSSKIIRKIDYQAQSEESPFLLESAVVSASSLKGD